MRNMSEIVCVTHSLLSFYLNHKWKAHRSSTSRNRTIVPVHQDDPHRCVRVNRGNNQKVFQAQVNETKTDSRQKEPCVVIDFHFSSDWRVIVNPIERFSDLSLAHRNHLCLARRAAAAAAEAFFARALRSSGVMVSRERFPPIFPPILPPFAPCLRKYSRTSGGSFFFAMHQS